MVKAERSLTDTGIVLNLELPHPGFVEISLFDEAGELSYNHSGENQVFGYNYEIPLSKLHGALYRLRAAFNGETILDEVVEIKKS
jgi:hypothetical protein